MVWVLNPFFYMIGRGTERSVLTVFYVVFCSVDGGNRRVMTADDVWFCDMWHEDVLFCVV